MLERRTTGGFKDCSNGNLVVGNERLFAEQIKRDVLHSTSPGAHERGLDRDLITVVTHL